MHPRLFGLTSRFGFLEKRVYMTASSIQTINIRNAIEWYGDPCGGPILSIEFEQYAIENHRNWVVCE